MSRQITGRNYNIADLYTAVFGHVALPYPLVGEFALPNPVDSIKAIAGTFQPPRGLKLGTPQFMPVSINGVALAIEPIVTVDGGKQIVRTRINGGKKRGTVKELFAEDDWQIRIEGFVEDDENEFPDEEIGDILDMFRENQTVEVDCALFQALGIGYMVIEKVSFPPMNGVQNLQAFRISGYSDDFPERELEIFEQ